jgi:hypothetical protein
VGLRAGTVAANSTGSKGTSAFVFFVLAFTTGQSSRKAAQPQRQNPFLALDNAFGCADGGGARLSERAVRCFGAI